MAKPRDTALLNTDPSAQKGKGIAFFVLGLVACIVLMQFSFGQKRLYPFHILSTWFHEMGHGLTAKVLGGEFHQLELMASGAGLATHSGVALGRLGRALVAAGGLLGPSIAAAILICFGRSRRGSSITLWVLGLVLLGSLLVVRGGFGIVFVIVVGLAVLGMAWKGSPPFKWAGVQILAANAVLGTWRDLDYMFSPGGVINGVAFNSDSQNIAEALTLGLLPYWFWGGVIALLSFLIIFAALRRAYK